MRESKNSVSKRTSSTLISGAFMQNTFCYQQNTAKMVYTLRQRDIPFDGSTKKIYSIVCYLKYSQKIYSYKTRERS